jgi:hypothetical protein
MQWGSGTERSDGANRLLPLRANNRRLPRYKSESQDSIAPTPRLAACQRIVDEFLEQAYKPGMTDRPRLGAFNGLTMENMPGPLETSLHVLTVREPRPPKERSTGNLLAPKTD